MHRGFVCLWRKSLDCSAFKNANIWYFWSYCLMKASHKKYIALIGFKEIEINPGQFIFGRRKASTELSLSEQEIRTCVRFLEKIGNLTQTSTQRFSLISIVNWDTYQDKENRTTPNINQQLTHSQPIANHIQQQQQQQPLKQKRKTFLSDSIEIRLSEYLFKHILRNNPDSKKPNIQVWAKSIDLMIRIDKRNPDQIKDVIHWCQSDDLWMSNILSTAKLRDKFDQLMMKMNKVRPCNEDGMKAAEAFIRERNGGVFNGFQ